MSDKTELLKYPLTDDAYKVHPVMDTQRYQDAILRSEVEKIEQRLIDTQKQWHEAMVRLAASERDCARYETALRKIAGAWQPKHTEALERHSSGGTEAFEDPDWIEAACLKELVRTAQGALGKLTL